LSPGPSLPAGGRLCLLIDIKPTHGWNISMHATAGTIPYSRIETCFLSSIFQLSLPEHYNVLSSYREARWNPDSRLPGPHAHSAHQRPRSNTALLPGISNRFPMTRNHSCPADQKSPAGKSKASYKLLVYGFCDTRRNRPLVYTYYITNTADDLCQRLVNCCMRLKSSASQDIHKDRRRSPIPITGVISYM